MKKIMVAGFQGVMKGIRENFINWLSIFFGILFIIIARIPYGISWWENILDGLGCSCISASTVAVFLDKQQKSQEEKRKKEFLKGFLQNYYFEVSCMMQRMIWFAERWEDETFNWQLESKTYSSLQYMIFSEQISSSYYVGFEKLCDKANFFAEKFSLKNVEAMDEQQERKLHKMIDIIMVNSLNVLKWNGQLDDNKVVLARTNILSLEQIESLSFHIRYAFCILQTRGRKNYGIAYSEVLEGLRMLRELGGYFDEKFKIGLQGHIQPEEL